MVLTSSLGSFILLERPANEFKTRKELQDSACTQVGARVFSRSLKRDGEATGTIHSATVSAPFRCVGPSNKRLKKETEIWVPVGTTNDWSEQESLPLTQAVLNVVIKYIQSSVLNRR